MFRRLSGRTICLSACVITGSPEEAYINPFHSPNTFVHAQDSARCHTGRRLEQPKTSSPRLLSLHWTLLIYTDRATYAPVHHQPLCWLEYGYYADTDIMSQPLNKECSREVGRSTIRWFLWYQWVCFLTTLTRYLILMICQSQLAKYKNKYLYENIFTISQTFMAMAILFFGKRNSITCPQGKTLFHVG